MARGEYAIWPSRPAHPLCHGVAAPGGDSARGAGRPLADCAGDR